MSLRRLRTLPLDLLNPSLRLLAGRAHQRRLRTYSDRPCSISLRCPVKRAVQLQRSPGERQSLDRVANPYRPMPHPSRRIAAIHRLLL